MVDEKFFGCPRVMEQNLYGACIGDIILPLPYYFYCSQSIKKSVNL